ncbi:MAG: lipase family protein [Crocinitomicaceae bacterium]|nr:lipase family protein [Crocinitomicaceae bacterium]
MKKLIVFIIYIVSFTASAQFKSGFEPTEARDMIQICNTFGYVDLYGSDEEIIPNGYQKVYTSPSLGMDNKFSVFKTKDKGAIVFRGTTSNMLSFMENFYATMIPVKGQIAIKGEKFKYQMGKETSSSIHAGYTLAIGFMKADLLKEIKELNKQGIYDIYITGHSQGGALATLVRAYLNYLPENELDKKNNFKVYAFANPMVGNEAFVKEYNSSFCENGMSYSIHNPEDFVPRLPISKVDENFWENNLSLLTSGNEKMSRMSMLFAGAGTMFKGNIVEMAKMMATQIEGMLKNSLGKFEMPAFKDEFNYVHGSNIVKISPTVYPMELKDSSILKNDSLMNSYKRDVNGMFENKELYKSADNFMQHKPYNYYTAILKDYFPQDYEALNQKYFVMPKK